jgi:hypothetical protein
VNSKCHVTPVEEKRQLVIPTASQILCIKEGCIKEGTLARNGYVRQAKEYFMNRM